MIIAKFFSGHLQVIINSVVAFSQQQESVNKIILHTIVDSVSHLIDKANKIAVPITTQVSELDKICSALSAPNVSERINTVAMLGEIPPSIHLLADLQKITFQLKNRSVLPNNDITEYATRLRHQINAFSYDFKQDYETLLKRHYKNDSESTSKLLYKARDIFTKTSDKNFIYFLISESLLEMRPEEVNLRQLISQISTTGHDVPYDLNTVNPAISLNINRNALNYVLTNLWFNAKKYRSNKNDVIIWSAGLTRYGACILRIRNPSQEYSDDDLIRLTEKGYQHSIEKEPYTRESYNEGLGLYLVDNICRHLLNISFEIKQLSVTESRNEFVCELLFNPNFIIKRDEYG